MQPEPRFEPATLESEASVSTTRPRHVLVLAKFITVSSECFKECERVKCRGCPLVAFFFSLSILVNIFCLMVEFVFVLFDVASYHLTQIRNTSMNCKEQRI